jgi:hypothetical protein
LVTATFLVDLLAPALRLPDWVDKLALTTHIGQRAHRVLRLNELEAMVRQEGDPYPWRHRHRAGIRGSRREPGR